MSDAAFALKKETRAAMELARALGEMGEDLDLKRDMIEGETGLIEAIHAALDAMLEQEVMRDGLALKIDELSKRKSAFDARVDGMRAAIEQAMTIAERNTLPTPTATLSLAKTPPKLTITDEALIPAKFWKQAEPTIDRAALNKALKDGEYVPGAVQGNGGITLKVRRL